MALKSPSYIAYNKGTSINDVPCLVDVLCRQQIKLFQVVSTSKFHENRWNDFENIFLVPAAFCRASEAGTQSRP